MTQSPNLHLPYLQEAQAQKHVTVNDALRSLDAVIHINIADKDLTAPPPGPADGERYIVAPAATGTWAGMDGKVAAFQDGAWIFYTPAEGWLVWIADEDQLYVHDGTSWKAVGDSDLQNIAALGVNTTADTTNKLAVASAAVLFNHTGAGVQHKLNKAAAEDTASVLFQNSFSGRAEFGLLGDDDWHVKVSPDGSTWHEAFIVDRNTGDVDFQNTITRANNTVWDTGNLSNLSDLDPAADSELTNALANIATLPNNLVTAQTYTHQINGAPDIVSGIPASEITQQAGGNAVLLTNQLAAQKAVFPIIPGRVYEVIYDIAPSGADSRVQCAGGSLKSDNTAISGTWFAIPQTPTISTRTQVVQRWSTDASKGANFASDGTETLVRFYAAEAASGSNSAPYLYGISVRDITNRLTLDGAETITGVKTHAAARIDAQIALTDSANIALDLATGNTFSVTLGGNRILDNPANMVAGQSGTIIVQQDATGGRTLAYGSSYKWPGGATPVLSPAAGAIDMIHYRVLDSSTLLCSLQQAFS